MIVIVALAVASMIGATLLQMAFAQRRQQQHDRLRVQAGWLAEAGLQRGLLRWRAEADYSGETWTVDVPGRTGSQAAEVQITLTEDAPRTITAVATYPTTTPFRARVRCAAPLNPATP
jgi:type II secretory pathway component PulK